MAEHNSASSGALGTGALTLQSSQNAFAWPGPRIKRWFPAPIELLLPRTHSTNTYEDGVSSSLVTWKGSSVWIYTPNASPRKDPVSQGILPPTLLHTNIVQETKIEVFVETFFNESIRRWAPIKDHNTDGHVLIEDNVFMDSLQMRNILLNQDCKPLRRLADRRNVDIGYISLQSSTSTKPKSRKELLESRLAEDPDFEFFRPSDTWRADTTVPIGARALLPHCLLEHTVNTGDFFLHNHAIQCAAKHIRKGIPLPDQLILHNQAIERFHNGLGHRLKKTFLRHSRMGVKLNRAIKRKDEAHRERGLSAIPDNVYDYISDMSSSIGSYSGTVSSEDWMEGSLDDLPELSFDDSFSLINSNGSTVHYEKVKCAPIDYIASDEAVFEWLTQSDEFFKEPSLRTILEEECEQKTSMRKIDAEGLEDIDGNMFHVESGAKSINYMDEMPIKFLMQELDFRNEFERLAKIYCQPPKLNLRRKVAKRNIQNYARRRDTNLKLHLLERPCGSPGAAGDLKTHPYEEIPSRYDVRSWVYKERLSIARESFLDESSMSVPSFDDSSAVDVSMNYQRVGNLFRRRILIGFVDCPEIHPEVDMKRLRDYVHRNYLFGIQMWDYSKLQPTSPCDEEDYCSYNYRTNETYGWFPPDSRIPEYVACLEEPLGEGEIFSVCRPQSDSSLQIDSQGSSPALSENNSDEDNGLEIGTVSQETNQDTNWTVHSKGSSVSSEQSVEDYRRVELSPTHDVFKQAHERIPLYWQELARENQDDVFVDDNSKCRTPVNKFQEDCMKAGISQAKGFLKTSTRPVIDSVAEIDW